MTFRMWFQLKGDTATQRQEVGYGIPTRIQGGVIAWFRERSSQRSVKVATPQTRVASPLSSYGRLLGQSDIDLGLGTAHQYYSKKAYVYKSSKLGTIITINPYS